VAFFISENTIFAQNILKMKNLVEELRWRGLVHDMMPGTEEQLTKESTTAYIGFDPTSDSLHIGILLIDFLRFDKL